MNFNEKLVKIAINKGFTKEQAEELAAAFISEVKKVFLND